MPGDAFRVSVARVMPGHESLPPPLRTGGEDDESPAMLGQCKNWPMLWPKNLIRVDAPGSTPILGKTNPPIQLAPSLLVGQCGREGGPTVPVADHVAPVDEQDDMEEDDDLNQYINTGYDGCPFDSGYDRERDDPNTEMPDPPEKERPPIDCKKSLFRQSSQDTPPYACTQDQPAEPRAMLSPTTMGVAVKEALPGSLPVPAKKQRKRPKKGPTAKASSSQPPPAIRVRDRVPIRNAPLVHIAGQPMLPPDALSATTGDFRRLHDHVLSTEKSLLRSNDPGYPLYAVKVPKGWGFYDETPADMFFLRFDYIFEMYHMRRLDFTFVRLFVLHLSNVVRKEQISSIAVLDPYFMNENFLNAGSMERDAARRYIEDFMVANKEKEMILLPYHPT